MTRMASRRRAAVVVAPILSVAGPRRSAQNALASRILRIADILTNAAAALALIMIAATVLVINHMIVIRLLGMSVVWNMELAIYLTIGAFFLGSPYAAKTKGHVAVDLLESALPPRPALAVRIVVHFAVLAVCIYMASVTGMYAWHAFAIDLRSTSLWSPNLWPVYASMPIGLGLTALQTLADLVRLLGYGHEEA